MHRTPSRPGQPDTLTRLVSLACALTALLCAGAMLLLGAG
jgi:hypothetical protein